MDLHEDIGDLIKEKLHTVEKPFEKDSWPRIQDSLHKKRKKRRIVFFIKFGLFTLLLTLLGFSILKQTPSTPSNEHKEIKSQEKVILPNDSTKKSNQLSNKKANIGIDNDVEIKINRIKDSIETQIMKYNEGSNDLTKTPQSQKTQTTKQKDSPKKLNVSQESFEKEKNNIPQVSTTKKIYYYYNSKDGQEMSSMDKKVIDSVMRANEYKQDSIKIDY